MVFFFTVGTFALVQLTLKIKFSRCILFYFNRVWSLHKWPHVEIFCNNYKTGHVATACPFILSKLKLCWYQRCPSLDQFCLSHKKIIRLTVYLTLVALTHILSITANFNAKLNKLKQMKTFDHTTLETIYFWSILSSVTYCISLWGCPNSLHAWSGRSVLLVLFIIWSPSIPKNEVLAKAKKCYSLSYLYKKRLACIAYQAYYNLTPPGIKNLFTEHLTKYNLGTTSHLI